MSRTLRRILLAGLAGLILLAAAIAAAAWFALDPEVLRAEAERRASAILGQPVTIGHLRVAFLPIPEVTGSRIRVGSGESAALSLAGVRLRPRVNTLFSRPVAIESVDLEGLTLTVRRDRAGRWEVPAILPAPTTGGDGAVAIERVELRNGRVRVVDEVDPSREAASIDAIDATVTPAESGLRLAPIAARIGSAAIRGEAATDPERLTLSFQMPQVGDADLDALLRLAGTARPPFLRLDRPADGSFTATVDRRSGQLIGEGRVRAPEVSVEALRLEGFSAPVALKQMRLAFAPTAFTVYGGTHRGTVGLNLAGDGPRWSLQSQVDGLRIGEFLQALTGADQRLDGTAAGAFDLTGRVGDALDRTMTGRIDVTVTNGVIRSFPLLAAVNRAVRLAEGDSRETRFERLTASWTIAGGQATTKNLRMDAAEMRVEAAGRVGFDRTIDLAGLAVLSPERTAPAIRSVRELSGLRNDAGELELPLAIRGTLDDPSFRIDLQAVLRRSLEDELRRRLRGIIRR